MSLQNTDSCNFSEIKIEPTEIPNAVIEKNYLNELVPNRKEMPSLKVEENEAKELNMVNKPVQNKTQRKPTCKICGKLFEKTNLFVLYDHIKKCSTNLHKCQVCEKEFYKRSLMLECLRSHKNETLYKCKICNLGFTDYDLTRHKHNDPHNSLKPNECNLCGRILKSNSNLTLHKAKCAKKSYECNQCEETFCNRSSMIKHRSTHTGEKLQTCKVCSKIFAGRAILRAHMIVHSTEKRFECEVCNKKFGRNCQLKQHSLAHSDERLYECSVCGRRFKQKSKMRQHYKTHKTNNNDKAECESEKPICDKNKIVEVNCEDVETIYVKSEIQEVDYEEETII